MTIGEDHTCFIYSFIFTLNHLLTFGFKNAGLFCPWIIFYSLNALSWCFPSEQEGASIDYLKPLILLIDLYFFKKNSLLACGINGNCFQGDLKHVQKY